MLLLDVWKGAEGDNDGDRRGVVKRTVSALMSGGVKETKAEDDGDEGGADEDEDDETGKGKRRLAGAG